MTNPARLYLRSGLIWRGALRAYWVTLVVRITIELDLPSLQLVLLGTAMEIAVLVAEVPTGVVADRFSRKWSIVIGFIATGLAQIGAGLADTFAMLVATQIMWGVAYTFQSGAATAWITDELGDHRLAEPLILRLARLQLVVSVAAIAVGAGLARLTTLSTAVVVSGLVLMATGAVLAVIMPERGFDRPTGSANGDAGRGPVGQAMAGMTDTLARGARATVSSPSLRVLLAVLIVSGLASEAVDRLDIRRLGDLGLADYDEVVLVGVIVSAQALVGALLLMLSQRRFAGAHSSTAMAVLLATSAIGIAALGLVAVLPIAAVGLIAQGGLRQAAQPFATTWTNANAPSSARATVHSFVEQANSIGEIGGGVALGLVAATTTVPTAMAISAVLMLIAATLAWRHGTAQTGR